MKKFRVLNIMDTEMDATNQRVAVVELIAIDSESDSIDSFLSAFSTEAKGERFVIDFNSQLTQYIIHQAKNEEFVELYLSEFKTKTEYRSTGLENIYYHNSVKNV